MLFSLEKRRLRGNPTDTNVYREEEGKWSQALLGGAQLMDKRRWAQVEIKTFKHKKNLTGLCQTLEQCPETVWSLHLRDTHSVLGQRP